MNFIRMPSPPETLAEATEEQFLERIQLDMSLQEHRALYSKVKANAADVIAARRMDMLTASIRLRSTEAGNALLRVAKACFPT